MSNWFSRHFKPINDADSPGLMRHLVEQLDRIFSEGSEEGTEAMIQILKKHGLYNQKTDAETRKIDAETGLIEEQRVGQQLANMEKATKIATDGVDALKALDEVKQGASQSEMELVSRLQKLLAAIICEIRIVNGGQLAVESLSSAEVSGQARARGLGDVSRFFGYPSDTDIRPAGEAEGSESS